MSRTMVKVENRKKKTNYKASYGSIFEKIRREREERNRKMLSQYKREIEKVVKSR